MKSIHNDWQTHDEIVVCQVLGSGMNLHLSTNFMLREIFELPPPLPAMDPTNASKMSKTERVSTNIFYLFETYYLSYLNLSECCEPAGFQAEDSDQEQEPRQAIRGGVNL